MVAIKEGKKEIIIMTTSHMLCFFVGCRTFLTKMRSSIIFLMRMMVRFRIHTDGRLMIIITVLVRSIKWKVHSRRLNTLFHKDFKDMKMIIQSKRNALLFTDSINST